jgi:preprotein translocase subunit Sec61beta
MPKSRRRTKSSGKEEKAKDTSPTVFTAAGLLAFSEEEAVIKLKPIHVLISTIALIAIVLTFSII